MDQPTSLDAIIAGNIYLETIINKDRKIILNNPGGSALYSAAGFSLWGKQPGILSKISENCSENWMKVFQTAGCDIEGIIKIQGAFEQVRFYAVMDDCQVVNKNPQKFFFEQQQPLPKYLLGYEPPASNGIDRSIRPSSITPDDIPAHYLNTGYLLIAPSDLYTCNMLPSFYRSKTDGKVILCGSSEFMQPAFWYEFPSLVRGVEVFIATEDQVKRLFLGKLNDTWEMIEFIASAGVDIVLVFSKENDHFLLFNPLKVKYRIPCLNTGCIDPIGTFSTFCGGFTSGYITHFDPIESALMGSVSASIKLEGTGPQYVMQGLPELARARANTLRDRIRVS